MPFGNIHSLKRSHKYHNAKISA